MDITKAAVSIKAIIAKYFESFEKLQFAAAVDTLKSKQVTV